MNWIDWAQWPLRRLSDAHDDLAVARHLLAELPARFARLEGLIMATAAEVVARLDSATTEVANDLSDLRSRLEEAVADKDQAVQDAVSAVLTDFDAPIARLEQLGQDPQNPVPDPEPTPNPDGGTDVVNPTPVDDQGNPVDENGNPI